MGRTLLCTTLEIIEGRLNLLIVNTHLESLKENSHIRQEQLLQAFKLIYNHKGPAILGGDLNLRNVEVNWARKQLSVEGRGDLNIIDEEANLARKYVTIEDAFEVLKISRLTCSCTS